MQCTLIGLIDSMFTTLCPIFSFTSFTLIVYCLPPHLTLNILTLTRRLAHHLRAIDKEEECARLVRNSTRHEGFCPYPEDGT